LQGNKSPKVQAETSSVPARIPSALSKLPMLNKSSKPPEPEPAPESIDPMALANLDFSQIGETISDSERMAHEIPMFADLIDAQAPERELPPEITHQQQGFVNLLDSIYEILVEPELFGQAVRTIMSELQTHQEYIQLVSDRDVNTLIRGMRQTMGLARARKVEKATKRGAPKKPTFDLGLDLGSLGL
jgi:hypothetical protein